MEIYNEIGYDLLDPGREISGLEDLPRVQAMEGEEGMVHLRNLALHKAASQEEALNLVPCDFSSFRLFLLQPYDRLVRLRLAPFIAIWSPD